MANRWGNSGNSGWLYFFGLRITADGDRSHEIKRRLLLGRKIMTNLDSILKSRDIRLVKAMVFPLVMYGCKSWTIKKAEQWGTDAFELWCWERLLRVPWTARRSNQSAAAKLLQSCPTLCDPIDGSPPGFPVPGILQGTGNTGVGSHFLLPCMKVKSESEVAQSWKERKKESRSVVSDSLWPHGL